MGLTKKKKDRKKSCLLWKVWVDRLYPQQDKRKSGTNCFVSFRKKKKKNFLDRVEEKKRMSHFTENLEKQFG